MNPNRAKRLALVGRRYACFNGPLGEAFVLFYPGTETFAVLDGKNTRFDTADKAEALSHAKKISGWKNPAATALAH